MFSLSSLYFLHKLFVDTPYCFSLQVEKIKRYYPACNQKLLSILGKRNTRGDLLARWILPHYDCY